jgi:hypothetical protein
MTFAASVAGTSAHSSIEPPEETMPPSWDVVDEWGVQSFPASDPPSNW